MNKLVTLGIASIGLLAMPAVPVAQGRGGGPKPAVVHPDGTVTFTTNAPNAKSVTLEGGWPGGNEHTRLPMVKDDRGFWTVTTPPIPPDRWTYSFIQDELAGGAGGSGTGAGGGRGGGSVLVMGPVGSESYNLEMRDVPHGTLSEVWYPAPKLKLASKFAYVYTPPGYETSKDRYPVLYLTCDQTSQWMQPGFRVPNIMDNLIAEGKAKPMIVVIAATIPNEAVDDAKLDDDPLPETVGLPSRFSADLNPHGGMLTLPPYLDGGTSVATDLVPFIDQRYRTIADRESRAIAGISAPGAAAFYAAATNPKTFAWVAGFSVGWPSIPGVWQDVPTPKDADTRFRYGGPDIRQNVDIPKLTAMLPDLTAKAFPHPIYLYQGLNDALIESHVRVKKMLEDRHVKYVSIESPNYAHEWRYWAWTLDDWSQHIFQEAKN